MITNYLKLILLNLKFDKFRILTKHFTFTENQIFPFNKL